MAIAKNTICLWYEKDAEAAAQFYSTLSRTALSVRYIMHQVTILPERLVMS